MSALTNEALHVLLEAGRVDAVVALDGEVLHSDQSQQQTSEPAR